MEDSCRRLKEQTEFINEGIDQFEALKVTSLRDIKKREKDIKVHIRQVCMNVLSYHPETFKKPKKMKDYSLLTANQASSLISKDSPATTKAHRPSPKMVYEKLEDYDDQYANSQRFYSSKRDFDNSKSTPGKLHFKLDQVFQSSLTPIIEDPPQTIRPKTSNPLRKSTFSPISSNFLYRYAELKKQ